MYRFPTLLKASADWAGQPDKQFSEIHSCSNVLFLVGISLAGPNLHSYPQMASVLMTVWRNPDTSASKNNEVALRQGCLRIPPPPPRQGFCNTGAELEPQFLIGPYWNVDWEFAFLINSDDADASDEGTTLWEPLELYNIRYGTAPKKDFPKCFWKVHLEDLSGTELGRKGTLWQWAYLPQAPYSESKMSVYNDG